MGTDREGMKKGEFNKRNDGKTNIQNANMSNKSHAHRLSKLLNNGIPVEASAMINSPNLKLFWKTIVINPLVAAAVYLTTWA
jgi:hypothetical protein